MTLKRLVPAFHFSHSKFPKSSFFIIVLN